MNNNAMTKKSNIKITKTVTGKIPDNVGFSKTDGYMMPLEEELSILEGKGFTVDRTPDGIFIDPPSRK
jgi:hypothetical protein